MGTRAERRIDEKGRITIPKSLRDRLGIEAGDSAVVELEDGQIVVKPRISREAFIESMQGCITEAADGEDADDIDPLELDRDWTSDLPG